jgi:alpha,alpha-trehalose phosphorylase
VAAAQIGYEHHAVHYFREALFVDLADTHGNTCDGVHIASAGGVWGAVVFGFAGLADSGVALHFAPSLPAEWIGMSFRLQRHGSKLIVDLDQHGCTISVVDGPPVPIDTDHGVIEVAAGSQHRVARGEPIG